MQLAIDLTPRQAARVLEQALRGQAELEIEPRNLPEDEPLRGKLVGREGKLLSVRVVDEKFGLPLSVLIGAFCEVRTVLSGELYLFTTCVLDAIEDSVPGRVLMVIPETIQVANRRQFERTNATVASQVRVWTGADETPSVGLLANVSADGLACNLPETVLDEALSLGDELRVTFELAGFDQIFELPAALCNKTLTRDRQQLSLGLKFNVQSDDPAAECTLQRLRAALFQLMANLTDMDGDL
ncbi:MAG: PilZ domain-containing protein [Phycisphaerae bacterium]